MELVVLRSILELQSDMGVDKLHKSLSTDLQHESESDHWWHYIVFISD